MPADPTANLGNQRMETLPDHIGHVAPSFEKKKRFNALALRPTYRISLRLGDLEPLFCTKPDTPAGRMARMQVLGLFYWPLNHRVAAGGAARPVTVPKLTQVRTRAQTAHTRAGEFENAANTADTDASAAKTATDEALAAVGTPQEAAKANTGRAAIQQAKTSIDAAKTAADRFKTAADAFKNEADGTEVQDDSKTVSVYADWFVERMTACKTASDANNVNWTTGDTDTAATIAAEVQGEAANGKTKARDAESKARSVRHAAPQADPRRKPNLEAYRVAWDYFKKNFCGKNVGTAVAHDVADKEIQKRLVEWVLQKYDATDDGCGYNRNGVTKGGGELPCAADDPSKPGESAGHFAKLRIPGGYPLLAPFDNGFNVNLDTSNGIPRMSLTDDPYVTESKVREHNEVLGKIPLVAQVEKYHPSDGKWHLAPGVEVRFQLVKPYDLPEFDANRHLNQQLNRPPMRDSAWSKTDPNPPTRTSGTGPRYFLKLREEHGWSDANVDDPQRQNAHHAFGGKREAPGGVDDVIFRLGKVAGFSKDHVAPPAAIGGGDARPKDDETTYFEKVESVNDATLHAVKTKTNAKGEAGVIFAPSRCGGDRYRFRAFVVADGMDEDARKGEGDLAVRVETGTLVLWRNVRFSRLATLRLPPPANLHAGMVAAATVPPDVNPPSGATRAERWMWSYLAIPSGKRAGRGLAKIEFDKALTGGKQGDPFDGLRANFARGFCELSQDPKAFTEITQDEWDAAVRCALEDAKRIGLRRYGLVINLEKLLYRDNTGAATDGVDFRNGFCLPARTPAGYDAELGAVVLVATAPHQEAAASANRTKVGQLMASYLYSGFFRSIARNGYLPGMTIVHALMGTNLVTEHGDFDLDFSGLAMDYNGAYNWYGCEEMWPEKIGDPVWFGYSYTSNVLHEIGHVLYKEHDAGLSGRAPNLSPAGGAQPDYHDNAGHVANVATDEPPHGTCVMSYRACEGQYCAKCTLGLRGWQIKGSAAMKATMAAPPPPPPPPAPAPPPPPRRRGLFGRLFGS